MNRRLVVTVDVIFTDPSLSLTQAVNKVDNAKHQFLQSLGGGSFGLPSSGDPVMLVRNAAVEETR